MRKIDIKYIKENSIEQQKLLISKIRETGTESAREDAIKKLNLMEDDFKENNYLLILENLWLYYEFMSDEDLYSISKYNKGNFDFFKIFKERADYICEKLNISTSLFFKHAKKVVFKKDDDYREFIIGLIFFGVRDILKPINEFIEDIKKSKLYKDCLS